MCTADTADHKIHLWVCFCVFGEQAGATLVEGGKFLLPLTTVAWSSHFLHLLHGHFPQARPPPPPPSHPTSLRHTGTADAWGAHLGEDLVKPLQWPVQVQLDPAGGAGHCLSPVRQRERVGDLKHVGHTYKSESLFLLW